MEISATASFWIGAIGTLVGLISTGIAIYQCAVINESNKRKSELQYLLAGINNAAIQKQVAWQNQINTLPKLESAQDWERARLYLRARDDLVEIASLTIALEGTIDTDNSAIKAMMDKSISLVQKNNQLQAEGLKNPTLNPKPDIENEH
ncbi:hypothetical protein P3450_14785 [Vibrio parahaemolyticus]|nr:hypothetical protein [Vibrio parahaemolyticus]MDF4507766.1 hypothetical protein [Vibrio parahaemolyticus]MDF4531006.1 hypothetical protein [Vibrio parahaemolyticus]MDG3368383.1 hypothetical protein [Vibrio parahaemolyticus]MDG3373002.1 hypothetical protein [Vibrio parahaemolyticus]